MLADAHESRLDCLLGLIFNCVLAPSATGFSTLFPGIKPHLLTSDSNFMIPLYREIILLLGDMLCKQKFLYQYIEERLRIVDYDRGRRSG